MTEFKVNTYINADLSGSDLSEADLRATDLSGIVLAPSSYSERNTFHSNLDNLFSNNTTLTTNIIRSEGYHVLASDIHQPTYGIKEAIYNHFMMVTSNYTDNNSYYDPFEDNNLSASDVPGNLKSAQLIDTNLTSSDLREVKMQGADLTGADLTNANLAYANFKGANLTNANLSNANLFKANLTGADLTNIDLSNALMGGSYLRVI